jgi:hypothetical protein
MVKWSVPARNDLKQIHDYIAKDSEYYAQNVKSPVVFSHGPFLQNKWEKNQKKPPVK